MGAHGKQREVLLRGGQDRGPKGNARQVVLEFVLRTATKKTLVLGGLIETVRGGPTIQDSLNVQDSDSLIHPL